MAALKHHATVTLYLAKSEQESETTLGMSRTPIYLSCPCLLQVAARCQSRNVLAHNQTSHCRQLEARYDAVAELYTGARTLAAMMRCSESR